MKNEVFVTKWTGFSYVNYFPHSANCANVCECGKYEQRHLRMQIKQAAYTDESSTILILLAVTT